VLAKRLKKNVNYIIEKSCSLGLLTDAWKVRSSCVLLFCLVAVSFSFSFFLGVWVCVCLFVLFLLLLLF
jgi:hypothetical protein